MNLTWLNGTETTVTADAAIDSDKWSLAGTVGFALQVYVSGLAPSGISGNLCIEVTNDPAGLTGWQELDGTTQSVDVASGDSVQFQWTLWGQFWKFARLSWVQAGGPDAGTLGIGLLSLTSSGAPAPSPPVQPSVLAENQGAVTSAIDRLAQYLRGLP